MMISGPNMYPPPYLPAPYRISRGIESRENSRSPRSRTNRCAVLFGEKLCSGCASVLGSDEGEVGPDRHEGVPIPRRVAGNEVPGAVRPDVEEGENGEIQRDPEITGQSRPIDGVAE